MKNQYVADSADFGKHGLLKALCHPGDEYKPLHLGIVWYMTPDEVGEKKDAPHAYLNPDDPDAPVYREADPALYTAMVGINASQRLAVKGIATSGIHPETTCYFGERVPPLQGKDTPKLRKAWAGRAFKATKECELVFLDPDNGLEPDRKKPGNTHPKHARIDEIKPYLDRGQSVAIYQNLTMDKKMNHLVNEKLDEIERKLGCSAFAMLYAAGRTQSWVSFIVIPAPEHRGRLRVRAETMTKTEWGLHFMMARPLDSRPLVCSVPIAAAEAPTRQE